MVNQTQLSGLSAVPTADLPPGPQLGGFPGFIVSFSWSWPSKCTLLSGKSNARLANCIPRSLLMGKKTASDILIETLIDWGVEFVFGIPGDGINGIMEALRTHQDKIRFIQTRHEEAAAFMACGYAKYTN